MYLRKDPNRPFSILAGIVGFLMGVSLFVTIDAFFVTNKTSKWLVKWDFGALFLILLGGLLLRLFPRETIFSSFESEWTRPYDPYKGWKRTALFSGLILLILGLTLETVFCTFFWTRPASVDMVAGWEYLGGVWLAASAALLFKFARPHPSDDDEWLS